VQAAVLGAVRATGFTSTRVLVPQAMPLRALTKVFRSTSLLLTAHGSGMINQVFKSVGKYVSKRHARLYTRLYLDQIWMPAGGAVLEVFPPAFAYGTGFSLAAAARHLHLSLWLDWADVDWPGTGAPRLHGLRGEAASNPFHRGDAVNYNGLGAKLKVLKVDAQGAQGAQLRWRRAGRRGMANVNTSLPSREMCYSRQWQLSKRPCEQLLSDILHKCIRRQPENAFSD
jgi:hypothetical protein|tara:strand:- start:568 stop:1251 length:684 start_codon:yes stop_codon:yes gene_type:complete